ncbi:MAG: hypothetical protein AAGK37_00130 [Pseudomonadota bacterium]
MPDALIFDVFGTCVDWRRSVAQDVAVALPNVDATAFATAWRAEYDPAMARIRDGGRGYVPLDDLHLENLERVSRDFGVTPSEPTELNRAWERLNPWPDVRPGLARLKPGFILAPCSNGSIALMTRLARYAELPGIVFLAPKSRRTTNQSRAFIWHPVLPCGFRLNGL